MPTQRPIDTTAPASSIRRRSGLAAAWNRIADFLLPPVCLACHKPLGGHDALCARCWGQVNFIRAPLCDRLGIPLPYDTGSKIVSAAALADSPDYDRARAVAHFDGVIREMIHGLKYADRHDGRRPFARWLSSAGDELLVDADLVVPVPLHRWRMFSGRYNQAAILAHELARLRGLPWHPGALTRVKLTPQQVRLTRDQRRRNMSAAFQVPQAAAAAIEGRKVVLIDDVITTGATVDACARALKAAGVVQVDVLSVGIVVV